MFPDRSRSIRRPHVPAFLPEYLLVALCGGVLYSFLEVCWRGWTHVSMSLCGAFCLSLFYLLEKDGRFRSLLLITRALIGGAVITAAEFSVGCLVNLVLRLNVWDYTGMPYSLLGQICLPMSALWILLSGAAFPLCDLIRRGIFRHR